MSTFDQKYHKLFSIKAIMHLICINVFLNCVIYLNIQAEISKNCNNATTPSFIITEELEDEEYLDILEQNNTLPDPFENRNRGAFKLHQLADKGFILALARRYDRNFKQKEAVNNFFENISEPITMINAILHLDLKNFLRASTRLIINSTIGFMGFNDFTSKHGLKRTKINFDETLKYWNIKKGNYCFIPGLGPHTSRSAAGEIIEIFISPTAIFLPLPLYIPIQILHAIHVRAKILTFTDKLDTSSLDQYIAVKSMYEQICNS